MSASDRQAPAHAPMTQFPSRDGELLVGGLPITRLTARVGSTPFYVYDRTVIAARISALRAALPENIKIHYAMKANPMPALVAHMAFLRGVALIDFFKPYACLMALVLKHGSIGSPSSV